MERWYNELESRIEVEAAANGELRHLCDAARNLALPIHSWYNLKEAFSADFPEWVVDYLARTYDFRPSAVLDPFVGGGTTVVSLTRRDIPVAGVEYNPFIAWVAQAKLDWQDYNPGEIVNALGQLTFDIPRGIRLDWPELTTFHQTKYFRVADVRVLLYLLRQIEDLTVSDLTKQFLRLGLVATVEDIANLRKDGRALRYVRKVGRPTALRAVQDRWHRHLDQLRELGTRWDGEVLGKGTIWRGTATNLRLLEGAGRNRMTQAGIRDSAFDLALISLHYLNNFDYSEIYKLELWLLAFVDSYHAWRELREGTLRSHHSVTFPPTAHLATDPATGRVAERLGEMAASDLLRDYAQQNMPDVISGYFDDMYLTLKELQRVIRPGGMMVYMVANSRHSDLPIATDLIIAEIARLIGFEPLKLLVLHKRNGRTRAKRYLRESVVILRKQ